MSVISSEESFFLALTACSAGVHRLVEKPLSSAGITVAQYNLLRIIENTPGITAGETRVRLMATAPSVAQLIAQLEGQGWIVRTQDDSDARKLHLAISPSGLKTLRDAHERIRAIVEELNISEALLASLTQDLSSLLSSLPSHGKR